MTLLDVISTFEDIIIGISEARVQTNRYDLFDDTENIYRTKIFLEKYAEKYRWHDLRKNPEDLPQTETEVDVVCERKPYPRKLNKNSKTIFIRTHGFYEDGTVLENDSIWSWEDIDGEYNYEEDCYIIPQGWWEFRHYNPEETYNGVIDDEVIAWREIEPFEGDAENERL